MEYIQLNTTSVHTYIDSDSDPPENDDIHDDVIDDNGNCFSDSSDLEVLFNRQYIRYNIYTRISKRNSK